jgi:hypothetical protein
MVSFYKRPGHFLCPNQVPIQLVTGFFSRGKAAGASSSARLRMSGSARFHHVDRKILLCTSFFLFFLC